MTLRPERRLPLDQISVSGESPWIGNRQGTVLGKEWVPVTGLLNDFMLDFRRFGPLVDLVALVPATSVNVAA